MKIAYTTAKVMEPRNGNNYSTTYYKLSEFSMDLVKAHIHEVLLGIATAQRIDPVKYDFIDNPIKGFRRTGNNPHYSLMDIVTDMAQQVIAGKDIPSGMLGRWNKIFNDTDWDIEITQPTTKSEQHQNKLAELFGGK